VLVEPLALHGPVMRPKVLHVDSLGLNMPIVMSSNAAPATEVKLVVGFFADSLPRSR